jgi:4,5-DOPA dioxygenase extradiol
MYLLHVDREPLPTIFLSHGSPMTAIEESPARSFWTELGAAFRHARAVLCVSAHWETSRPAVTSGLTHETIHDFYGFPPELYRLRYPAHGAPALAERVAQLAGRADLTCDLDAERGLDHGAWVPLLSMFPAADMPVAQLSIQSHLDPTEHFALGAALQELRRDGVLVLGSGGAVHPLGYAGRRRMDVLTDDWAVSFENWLVDMLARGDLSSLLDYRALAPYPERAHPRPDHFMPLFVALGAAGPAARGRVLHQSWARGDMSMTVFELSEPR